MSKRLIVTADDFGMSLEVNEAVEQAHREGILTCASLVVAGNAAEDAVRRAKRLPTLGVGLHLALFGAKASHRETSRIAPDGENLGESPALTGTAIMLSSQVRAAARREIDSQFEAYRRTGLPLGHLDGHWHCHQHPAVLVMALERGRPLGLKAVRIPYESFAASKNSSAGIVTRAVQALSHWPLAAMMRRQVSAAGLAMNDNFIGKNDAGYSDEAFLLRLARKLPMGVTELGLHPSTRNWQGPHAPPADWRPAGELAALTSHEVRQALATAGVKLCRWSDLG